MLHDIPEPKIREVSIENYLNTIEPLNGRITAIYWGMIPWGIVLSLDIPENESIDAFHRRVFFVFENISNYHIPLVLVDTVAGLFVDYFLITDTTKNGITCQFSVLRNRITSNTGEHSTSIKISACNIRCFQSESQSIPNDNSWLSFQELQILASESDLYACYSTAQPYKK